MTEGTRARRPRRKDVDLRLLPDGLAILDLEGEAVHVLNQSAAFVFLSLDGERTLHEIAAEIAAEVQDEAAQRDAPAHVEACLAELERLGLVAA